MADRASQLSSRRRERSLGRLQLPTASNEEAPATELAELRVELAKLQAKLKAEATKHEEEIAVLVAKHRAEATRHENEIAKHEAEMTSLRDENAALQAALSAARDPATAAKEAAGGKASAGELAEERNVRAAIADEEATGACTFSFVPISRLLAGQASGEKTLPSYQSLHDEGVLVERTLTRSESYRAMYCGKLLAISHRWEHPDAPDTQGVQYQAILKHIAGTGIELVWFECVLRPRPARAPFALCHSTAATPSPNRAAAPLPLHTPCACLLTPALALRLAALASSYWCMPQGERTLAQKARFLWMLKNVNLLYLGCSVLLLVDISYLSRFCARCPAPIKPGVSLSHLLLQSDAASAAVAASLHLYCCCCCCCCAAVSAPMRPALPSRARLRAPHTHALRSRDAI